MEPSAPSAGSPTLRGADAQLSAPAEPPLQASALRAPRTPAAVLALQRCAGNRATRRWLARAPGESKVDPRPLKLEIDHEPGRVFSVTEYEQIPRADGGTDLQAAYWARFEVENGVMIISVRTRLADDTRSPTLRYGEQFDQAMAWFAGQGVEVREIETEWSYMTLSEKSRNLAEYERLLSEGLPPRPLRRRPPGACSPRRGGGSPTLGR